MARHLKVRLPTASERRQLREILEESTDACLCRWAAAWLFYSAGLGAQFETALDQFAQGQPG